MLHNSSECSEKFCFKQELIFFIPDSILTKQKSKEDYVNHSYLNFMYLQMFFSVIMKVKGQKLIDSLRKTEVY